MASLPRGTVKAVSSGDTIIVMGNSNRGPPPEKQLTLAHIMTPRLGRRDALDEPFAWQSREFLRRLVIGQQVAFKVDGATPQGREFAHVFFGDQNLSLSMVKAGWARVKNIPESKQDEEYTALVDAETAAKESGIGLWTSDKDALADSVNEALPELEPSDVLAQCNGKPQPAMVEYVRDGNNLRVTLLPSRRSIWVQLVGVSCPYNKQPPQVGDNKVKAPPAPFELEAKFVTECRVLHRDVAVTLEAVDKFGNFLGTVRFAEGNLGEVLLSMGLAKVNAFTASRTSTAATLRNAERKACEARLRVWRDFVPQTSNNITPSGNAREYAARVVEVVSGDCVILNKGDGKDTRVFLSNIRAPKLGRRDAADAPFAWEAREHLRQKTIGRRVKVYVDYVKPGTEGYPDRTCVTLMTENGVDLAESLVKQGLVSVFKLRVDSDERSLHYDALLNAETFAQTSKQGMHGKKEAPVHRFTDLSGPNSKKSPQFLSGLQRGGKLKGIVEYVFGGARLKVVIPRENVKVMLAIAGVRAPRYNRDGQSEPFGTEAYNFTREIALQRDVEVDIYDVDRNGTFFGGLTVGKKNLAVALVEEGLAWVDNADRISYGTELREAEEGPRKAKRRVWESYTPPVDTEEVPSDPNKPKDVLSVSVVEIVSAAQFYVHTVDDAVSSLTERIKKATISHTSDQPVVPRKHDTVLAQFSGDNDWYRARVLEVSPDQKEAHVFYLDYGNSEVVPATAMRPLNQQSLADLKPQAVECSLAHVKLPAEDDDNRDLASHEFRNLVWDKPLKATVWARDGAKLIIQLKDEADQDISLGLVQQGLARVPAQKKARWGAPKKNVDPQAQPIVDGYRAAQEAARGQRLGMWRYGDPGSDDESPEFGYTKPAV